MVSCHQVRKEACSSVPAHVPMGPVSEMHAIFRNRGLPSTSWGQLRAVTTTDKVLDIWTTCNNNSKEGISYLVLGMSVVNIVSPDGKILFKLCLYISLYIELEAL